MVESAGGDQLAAVALIGFAVAPIFPALVSGTSQRVGARFAANTIGMQMAAASLGTALIPGLVGILPYSGSGRDFGPPNFAGGHSPLPAHPVCQLVRCVQIVRDRRKSGLARLEFATVQSVLF